MFSQTMTTHSQQYRHLEKPTCFAELKHCIFAGLQYFCSISASNTLDPGNQELGSSDTPDTSTSKWNVPAWGMRTEIQPSCGEILLHCQSLETIPLMGFPVLVNSLWFIVEVHGQLMNMWIVNIKIWNCNHYITLEGDHHMRPSDFWSL